MKQNPLTYCFNKAKQYYKDNDLDKTREYLDMGLAQCAMFTSEIMDSLTDEQLDQRDVYQRLHKDVVYEGYPLETWKMRFWVKLENWGLLL